MTTLTSQVTLQYADIQNFNLLVARLLDQAYAPSAAILELLPGELLVKMREAEEMAEYTATLKSELVSAFNDKVICSSAPLPLSAFTGVELTAETKSWDILHVPTDRMNRRLLAEAYPASIQVEYSRKDHPDEWFQYYVAKFILLSPRYAAYAERLKKQFETVCKELAPLAIVQARPKTVGSFAEKVWRKEKYVNPLAQITDLCGARVITETNDEVERICCYIWKSYTIDKANSDDARNRLGVTEFGYQAVHFIVQLLAKDLDNRELYGLKGEVQVKTLLQHAWSSICHDRIYKSAFHVPERIKRDLHRVAASLEESDKAFGRSVIELDDYKTHYGAYMTQEDIEKEIQTQQAVLDCTPDITNQRAVRMKIAHLHKAIWGWKDVVAILDPLLPCENALILAEHGYALCRVECDTPAEARYCQGMAELELAKALAKANEKANICSYLAWVYANAGKHGEVALYSEARDLYREAYELDNTDPYALASYLEFEVYCERTRDFAHYMRFTISYAIRQCETHIRAGIEMPWAFFTIGRLYLLLNEHNLALNAYCKGISHCLCEGRTLPDDVLQVEREFLKNINFAKKLPEQDQWVDSLLLIALWLRTNNAKGPNDPKNPKVSTELTARKKHDLSVGLPLVIVAGGTDDSVNARMQLYRHYLAIAFQQFNGSIVSGGTTSGIAGLMANIVRERNAGTTPPPITLLGYLPSRLPADATRAAEYHLFETPGAEFSPEQPIQAWIDLIVAGIDPKEVLLLGINGGAIAVFEYQVALAFGAKVGLFAESGRAVQEISSDIDWQTHPNLVLLPHDQMIAWAFIHAFDPADPVLAHTDATLLDETAKAIHDAYVQDNKESAVPPSAPIQVATNMTVIDETSKAIHTAFVEDNKDRTTFQQFPQFKPWEKLDPSFRKSNYSQAKFMFIILRTYGYTIQPAAADTEPVILDIPNDDAWKMAEMEHGRFVVERELDGWRYGEPRNDQQKIHPCLVPWDVLTYEVKEKDYKAVKNWPRVLAIAKLEVVKPVAAALPA